MPEEKDNSQETPVKKEKLEILKQIDFIGVHELVAFLKNPKKVFFYNFLAGIGRGLGFAVGFTVLTAIAILLMRRAVSIPVLGNYIAKILEFIEAQRQVYR